MEERPTSLCFVVFFFFHSRGGSQSASLSSLSPLASIGLSHTIFNISSHLSPRFPLLPTPHSFFFNVCMDPHNNKYTSKVFRSWVVLAVFYIHHIHIHIHVFSFFFNSIGTLNHILCTSQPLGPPTLFLAAWRLIRPFRPFGLALERQLNSISVMVQGPYGNLCVYAYTYNI
ncbi:hypothetical protein B0F90DRAFT_1218617 [Multifurca ochricompacta]|uniref:Uncharacterized protein n=1 Tax=Multifurca ochricompacta TaxID=376703 RepID=A0AAD4QKP8_9AGAM|nr:hypothetical protein B0F90DRAFT_1218617 [Multifurca ochricompacta]